MHTLNKYSAIRTSQQMTENKQISLWQSDNQGVISSSKLEKEIIPFMHFYGNMEIMHWNESMNG